MPRSRLMRARFTSPCPFCGRRITYNSLIKQTHELEWMHPHCADYDDAGKSWTDLRRDERLKRISGHKPICQVVGIEDKVEASQRRANDDVF